MRAVVVGLLVLLTVPGYGADQTVLGRRLQVTNPGGSSAGKVRIDAKETSSDDTLVGDPTVGGAELIVRLDGGTPTSQTFELAVGTSTATGKPFWSGDAAHGFSYKDSHGENGPLVRARIRLVKGTFVVSVQASGKVGAVVLVPPNPGSSGCATFRILGGDDYDVSFATGDVTNRDTRLFRVSHPTAEGSCAGVVTTTSTTSTTLGAACGNGVIEPGEMCDGESFCTSTCGIALYACCNVGACDGECTPIGESCLLACGFDNPIYLGSHPTGIGSCPGAPGNPNVGLGTCAAPDAIAPTNVCCPLSGGGCSTTPVTNTEELQSAVLDCAESQGSTDSVIGTCVTGACVPAH